MEDHCDLYVIKDFFSLSQIEINDYVIELREMVRRRSMQAKLMLIKAIGHDQLFYYYFDIFFLLLELPFPILNDNF